VVKQRLHGVFAALVLSIVCMMGPAEATFEIVSFGGNGELRWAEHPDMVRYKVQWASSLEGEWYDSWEMLRGIEATGSDHTVLVPMFYRVVGVDAHTVLIVHGDGEHGSKRVADEMEHAIQVRGDAHISTEASRFGGSSVYFDGNGDYLESPVSDDWGFGTGDFTAELWVNFSLAPSVVHLIGLHTSGINTEWSLVYEGNALKLYILGLANVAAIWSPLTNRWYHLAAVRTSGTTYLFIDGQLRSTGTSTASIVAGRTLTIGAANNPTLFMHGYVDEVRISKGVARWTSNFTPPESAYPY
jgi:hypothetical protein